MKQIFEKYREPIKQALSTQLNELYDYTDALELSGVDPSEYQSLTKMEQHFETLRKNFLAGTLTPLDESGIILVLKRRVEVAEKELESLKKMIDSMETIISEIESEVVN